MKDEMIVETDMLTRGVICGA